MGRTGTVHESYAINVTLCSDLGRNRKDSAGSAPAKLSMLLRSNQKHCQRSWQHAMTCACCHAAYGVCQAACPTATYLAVFPMLCDSGGKSCSTQVTASRHIAYAAAFGPIHAEFCCLQHSVKQVLYGCKACPFAAIISSMHSNAEFAAQLLQ